jgi:beta-1,4-N-acetylglucosaminyltransferase
MQLHSLGGIWQRGRRCWVTLPAADTEVLLQEERVHWAHGPTNRNIPNLFRNLRLAFRVLRRERPDAVLSTGAGVSVPFVWAARWLGIRTVFIEDLTRVSGLSLSGKLVYRVADVFLVQWPELAARLARAEYRGRFL